MIDRILVVCQTKQESLKWVDTLRNQIKVCRLPAASQQLPQPPQQLPFHSPGTPASAHVSSPPYLQLTSWIRRKLESEVLTIQVLRKILKSDFFDSNASNRIHFVKRHRHHKVECIIFPSREIPDKGQSSSNGDNKSSSGLFKRELVLDYESVDPSGFIRCFDPSRETSRLSDDEITFLVPDQSRSSSSSSSSAKSSATPSYVSSYGTELTIVHLLSHQAGGLRELKLWVTHSGA